MYVALRRVRLSAASRRPSVPGLPAYRHVCSARLRRSRRAAVDRAMRPRSPPPGCLSVGLGDSGRSVALLLSGRLSACSTCLTRPVITSIGRLRAPTGSECLMSDRQKVFTTSV
eukprot:Selendium_serpulae@DN8689_c0_g1_i1.p2